MLLVCLSVFCYGNFTLTPLECRNAGLDNVDGMTFFKRITGVDVRLHWLRALTILRDHGYQLGAITNNWETQDDPSLKEVLFDHFDFVIESYKVGIRKPDTAIYQLALEQLQLLPQQCVFLDDLGINLKSAKNLGIHTIKVSKNDREALEMLGDILGLVLVGGKL
eukprot:TRINITY_DN7108_c0_g1_i2.p1 TRINITY_DN7108_c0_g1~~TRINITY_DN7108_c0_g1_i2.p1  ORF type:complete len:165 (-),score=22.80 TRINITY_DN7108_c0_g1_i2:61-555(-)